MAQQLHLHVMTADSTDNYVQQAQSLAGEVAQCRLLISELKGKYSTCDPVDSDEPPVLSACRVRHTLCEHKLQLYGTGNIDFGGAAAERNPVTEEWELFLKRIVWSIRSTIS